MNFPAAAWRLLKTPPAPGPWNMAVDEAVLEAVGRGDTLLPTLRLYAWEPACLSLGHSQPFADADRTALEENGWDIVRRITGGRAILHTDELTYAVITSPDEPRMEGDIITSYERISKVLLAALESLALPVTATPQAKIDPTQANPVCFEIPSHYEITVDDKKLIGSAQARRKEGILQHGTLPLTGDLARITHALAFDTEQARQAAAARLTQKALTVETALGRRVRWDEAAAAFENAFSSILSIQFEESNLTPTEQARAEALLIEKYTAPAWTHKK